MENVIKFLKELFGDNFELKALSYKEGEILPINELDEKTIESFFIDYLEKTTIWYDPFNKVLFSYKPQKDSFFKKAITNAWAFKYIFYPFFIEDWGGWWSNYVFHIYEKGLSGNYKFQYLTEQLTILQGFLPKVPNQDELRQAIIDSGYEPKPQNMKYIMGYVKDKYPAADGSKVVEIIRQMKQ